MTTKRVLAVAGLLVVWPVMAFGQAPELGSQAIDEQTAAAVRAYWTLERMASAIPRDLLQADMNNPPAPAFQRALAGEPSVFLSGRLPGASEDLALPEVVRASADSGGAEPLTYTYPYPFTRDYVVPWMYNEPFYVNWYPYITIGKLFFTLRGINFVCSAAVGRPHLVVTARHCIFDYVPPGPGSVFATNVSFCPAWDAVVDPGNPDNDSLGGCWPARNLATWVANAPNFQYDIGFIQLPDWLGGLSFAGCGGSAGSPIEFLTGFLGTAWGGTYDKRHWDEFGYPQGAPFNGTTMFHSSSSTAALDQFGQTDTVEVGSDFTGGSSGGPWVLGFRQDIYDNRPPNALGCCISGMTVTGGNFINGLNSFKWTNPARPLGINSPQFHDYNFNQLRLFSEGLACP